MIPPEFDHYLEQIRPYIKWKRAWDRVETELVDFLYTSYEKSIDKGFTYEESIHRALDQIGPSEIVGPAMHEAFRPNWAWSLMVLVSSYTAFGALINVMQGISSTQILVNVGLCFLLFFAGLLVDRQFLEKHCRLIYWALMLIQTATVFIGERAAVLAPSIYLMIPIVFAGIIRRYAFQSTQGIVFCFAHLLLPILFCWYSGEWIYLLGIHITCIVMLCYARKRNYFMTKKSVVMQDLLLFTGSLIGLLPAVIYLGSSAESVPRFRLDFTFLALIIMYFIFFYYSIRQIGAAGTGMDELIVVGVISLYACFFLFSVMGADAGKVNPLFRDIPFLSHGWPDMIFYLLFGIQIGAIRDSAVVLDSSCWCQDP